MNEQTPEPRPLTETRTLYDQSESELSEKETTAAQARQEEMDGKSALRAAQAESIRLTAEQHRLEREAFTEARQNPCADWCGLAEMTVKAERTVRFLDRFVQWSAEIELPRLRLLTLHADADVAAKKRDIAKLRAEMADRKFRDDMATINTEQCGVVAVSRLVESLYQEASTASDVYNRIMDGIKEEISRQGKRAQQIASVGVITSRNVAGAIPQY